MERRSRTPFFFIRATRSRLPGSVLQRCSLKEGNVCKQIGVIVLLAFALATSGCGSTSVPGSGSGNINGTWTATLSDTNGSPAYTFSTTFSPGTSGSLTVTNFTFTLPGPCFDSYQADQYSENGTFSLNGNFSGSVSGTFAMTISTLFPTTNNVLTLNGTVNGSTISGTWKATGLTGCSGTGSFNLQPTMG